METKFKEDEILNNKLNCMLRGIDSLRDITLFEVAQSQSSQLDFFSAYDEVRFSIQMHLFREIEDREELNRLMKFVDGYLDKA